MQGVPFVIVAVVILLGAVFPQAVLGSGASHESVVEVMGVVGQGSVIRTGEGDRAIAVGATVPVGGVLVVDAEGQVELGTATGLRLKVKENTALRLVYSSFRTTEASPEVRLGLELDRGELQLATGRGVAGTSNYVVSTVGQELVLGVGEYRIGIERAVAPAEGVPVLGVESREGTARVLTANGFVRVGAGNYGLFFGQGKQTVVVGPLEGRYPSPLRVLLPGFRPVLPGRAASIGEPGRELSEFSPLNRVLNESVSEAVETALTLLLLQQQ